MNVLRCKFSPASLRSRNGFELQLGGAARKLIQTAACLLRIQAVENAVLAIDCRSLFSIDDRPEIYPEVQGIS